MPGVVVHELVGADQEDERHDVAEFAPEFAERVDRERGPAAVELPGIDREAAARRAMGIDGGAQHGEPVVAGRRQRMLLPRTRRRQETHLVERERRREGVGHREVGIVDRVEAAAEEADHRRSQSRGTR